MGKNKNKNKNTMAVVPYNAKQTALVPKKKVKSKSVLEKPGAGILACYRAALSTPFAAEACGARVPDMFSVPTKASHVTRRYTIQTNASGEADLVVLPSAYWHMISPRGSIVGGGDWTSLDNNTVSGAVGYTSTSSLATQFANYRIVGYGVRLVGMASMTNNSGVMVAAKVPISSYINSRGDPVGGITSNATNTNATKANTLIAYGVPTSSSKVDLSQIPSLPDACETSLVKLSEGPMEIIPKISSANAFNFRLPNDSAIGFNITDQTSLSYVNSGDASYLRLDGHEAVIIGFTGCANSTSVCEIEVIYHLEGIPSTTTTQYIVADSVSTAVDPVGFMNVVKEVANLPSFRSMATGALNSFYPGLGTLANRLF